MNNRNFEIAKMNSKGVIMASRRAEINEDEYEDETKYHETYSYI